VVDHLPQNPKIEGSSPTAASGTGREIIAKQLAPLCQKYFSGQNTPAYLVLMKVWQQSICGKFPTPIGIVSSAGPGFKSNLLHPNLGERHYQKIAPLCQNYFYCTKYTSLKWSML
jgi:hypothetical protein